MKDTIEMKNAEADEIRITQTDLLAVSSFMMDPLKTIKAFSTSSAASNIAPSLAPRLTLKRRLLYSLPYSITVQWAVRALVLLNSAF